MTGLLNNIVCLSVVSRRKERMVKLMYACRKGGVRLPKGGRGSVVERWRLKSVALGSIPGGCPDFVSSS